MARRLLPLKATPCLLATFLLIFVHGISESVAENVATNHNAAAISPLDGAFALTAHLTNLLASVDISTVDRRASQSAPTLTKEN